MRLPNELRNLVYKELLIEPEHVEICFQYVSLDGIRRRVAVSGCRRNCAGRYGSERPKLVSQQAVRAVFLTSRTVYRESTSIYFAYNTFELQ